MNGGTALAVGLSGLLAAEATGVTNFSDAEKTERPGDQAPIPTVPAPSPPSSGGMDPAAVKAIVEAIPEPSETTPSAPSAPTIIKTGDGQGGGSDRTEAAGIAAILAELNKQKDKATEKKDEATETTETAKGAGEIRKEITKLRDKVSGDDSDDSTSSPSESARPYDLRRDYDGVASEEVSGGAEVLKKAGDMIKSGTSGTEKFAEENPYFTSGATAGAAAGSVVPGVGNVAGATTGAAAGGVAEIVSDTVTGGTPLGVQSPINNDDDGALWDGGDPLNLGRFTGKNR